MARDFNPERFSPRLSGRPVAVPFKGDGEYKDPGPGEYKDKHWEKRYTKDKNDKEYPYKREERKQDEHVRLEVLDLDECRISRPRELPLDGGIWLEELGGYPEVVIMSTRRYFRFTGVPITGPVTVRVAGYGDGALAFGVEVAAYRTLDRIGACDGMSLPRRNSWEPYGATQQRGGPGWFFVDLAVEPWTPDRVPPLSTLVVEVLPSFIAGSGAFITHAQAEELHGLRVGLSCSVDA